MNRASSPPWRNLKTASTIALALSVYLLHADPAFSIGPNLQNLNPGANISPPKVSVPKNPPPPNPVINTPSVPTVSPQVSAPVPVVQVAPPVQVTPPSAPAPPTIPALQTPVTPPAVISMPGPLPSASPGVQAGQGALSAGAGAGFQPNTGHSVSSAGYSAGRTAGNNSTFAGPLANPQLAGQNFIPNTHNPVGALLDRLGQSFGSFDANVIQVTGSLVNQQGIPSAKQLQVRLAGLDKVILASVKPGNPLFHMKASPNPSSSSHGEHDAGCASAACGTGSSGGGSGSTGGETGNPGNPGGSGGTGGNNTGAPGGGGTNSGASADDGVVLDPITLPRDETDSATSPGPLLSTSKLDGLFQEQRPKPQSLLFAQSQSRCLITLQNEDVLSQAAMPYLRDMACEYQVLTESSGVFASGPVFERPAALIFSGFGAPGNLQ